MKSKKTVSGTGTEAGRPLPAPTPEQVAALAHAIWVDRGRPEGSDVDNWLEAERQLKGEVQRPLAADDLPASDEALDPARTLKTNVDRELDRIVSPTQPRSSTSL